MIYSPYLWGSAQTAAELDGGSDAANMLAARESTLAGKGLFGSAFKPAAPLHPYIAAAVPAVLAAAGAPAVAAAAAGAVMSAASAPPPAPSSGDMCGACVSKASAIASQVATEEQVTGGSVAAQLVPPAPTSSGIPWHWFLVLALVLAFVMLSPSKR